MPENEQSGIELLLSDPDLVAWLEPEAQNDDEDSGLVHEARDAYG